MPFSGGRSRSRQDALGKLALPPPEQVCAWGEPQPRFPTYPPTPLESGARSEAGGHLQVGGEDTEVGGQLREPQVGAVHPEQHPAIQLTVTA